MDAALTDLTAGFAVRQLTGAQTGAPHAPGSSAAPAEDADAVDAVAKGDSITLSDAAQSVLNGDGAAPQGEDPPPGGGRAPSDAAKGGTTDAGDDADAAGAQRGANGEPLSDEDVQEVEHLEDRDQEVRTHEQAHQAAGGQHAGSPSYDYETGPDGKQYATSGEVPIDTGVVANDPEATIAKMEQVKRAALAPAEPSAADRAIAAKADQAKLKAARELAEKRAGEATSGGEAGGVTEGGASEGKAIDAGATEAEQTDPNAPRGSLLSLTA